MAPTAAQTTKGYAHLWDEMQVTKKQEAVAMANRILKNKVHYVQIETDTGVPWIMAAVIHMRESDLDFQTHMHNGDPLTNYTYHVPKGRPKVGHGPPFAFVESTDDAFKLEGFDKLKGQYTLELILFGVEGFNGWGYLPYGNSPYVWAWTNQYHGGKFKADHDYDPDVWDQQPGCAAIIYTLADMDPDAKKWTMKRGLEQSAVNTAVGHATRKERGVAQGGAAAGAAGTTSTVAVKPEAPGHKVAMAIVGGAGILIGFTVLVVAVILLQRKKALLLAKLHGAA